MSHASRLDLPFSYACDAPAENGADIVTQRILHPPPADLAIALRCGRKPSYRRRDLQPAEQTGRVQSLPFLRDTQVLP
jgi:hypothetical protein